MKTHNQRLTVALIFLLILNTVIFFLSDFSDTNVNAGLFSVNANRTESIKITQADQNLQLQKKGDSWLVNNAHQADQGIINVLLAVLQSTRVKRELGKAEKSNLKARLQEDGRLVEVFGSSNVKFWMNGNPTKTKTFYWNESMERAYEVELPGYTDFVGSIFMLTPNQWRDRTIFSGNASTIESLIMSRGKTPSLEIKLENRFFQVEGIAAIDTTKLLDYLNEYINLQANERIDIGDHPQYDSLSTTDPMAVIEIQDVATDAFFNMKIFPPLPNHNIHLVIDNKGAAMVFDKQRINQLLKHPSDFSL